MELVTPGLGLLFWTLLTFLIVLFVLSRYAWKPIITAVKEREQTIADALNSAEAAKNEIAQLRVENQNLLEQARLERDKILKDATAAANTIIAEAREKALAEGAKIMDNARQAIITEKNAAMTDVKNQIAILSVQVAEKIIKKQLDNDKAQKELVGDFIKDIKLN